MTSKSKLDKLEKIIKPRQDQGRKVKVTVPISTIYKTDAPDPVIEMRENQIEEMDRTLEIIYGKDQEAAAAE